RGGLEAAERMMKGVHIPVIAPSLGGVESLMTRPALTSHAGLTPEARQTIGIGDGLIRMSVGIEDVDELIADLKQALDKV
ncbi:MAG: PLP-dependent transferase, partial [Calditrichaeota bacterium]|nr:PLP-dependent transferase [Calditrichota bacterium]